LSPVLTGFWLVLGLQPLGACPVPNWWGMLIATFCLIQLYLGVVLDRRYDPAIGPFYFWAVLYPLGYWFLMSLITVASTPKGLLFKSSGPTKWRTRRTGQA
jgi:poly-beta-1,6-N-acetyl-D-glucosamine synthase